MRESIGRYVIEKQLGEGGMGVVFVGLDERLRRRAAVKVLKQSAEWVNRERLLREARTAASVNHPGICHVYEVGEDGADSFIAMELLDGEALSDRLIRGPMGLDASLQACLGVLNTLEALHEKGLLHRDIKPSNVFLTEHGPKLLDFGLAQACQLERSESDMSLTQPGTIVGTPSYIAPERWSGEPAGPASDLFAVGALLFEMLTGKIAFPGRTVMEVFEAISNRPPPVITGGPDVMIADRIVQQALEKQPQHRYQSAGAMARDVREAMAGVEGAGSTGTLHVRRVTRLIALPFELLREDTDADFLRTGLPDAIAESLSGLESVLIRSSRAFPKLAAGEMDIKALGREAQVDAVLSGSILRAGERVRVSVQLTEAPTGTILCTKTTQAPMGDLFQLQDLLAREIVESLSAPLSGGEEAPLTRDVPASPSAFELYLRANQAAYSTAFVSRMETARDLYRTCLEKDPRYAPGWAQLARVYRIMAKYGRTDNAENLRLAHQAFDKAFELNPDLAIAHNYFTYYQVDQGQSLEAMVRLLERAHSRPDDPDLFAGLVVVLRVCGLLESSLAAHRRAIRLAPTMRTGVHFTYWMQGNYERAMAVDDDDPPFCRAAGPAMLGRHDDSLAIVRLLLARGLEGLEEDAIASIGAALEGQRDRCREILCSYRAEFSFRDPEGIFLVARNLAKVEAVRDAVRLIRSSVERGFACHATLRDDPWLDPLRSDSEFQSLLSLAEEKHRSAMAAFEEAEGERLLGRSQPDGSDS